MNIEHEYCAFCRFVTKRVDGKCLGCTNKRPLIVDEEWAPELDIALQKFGLKKYCKECGALADKSGFETYGEVCFDCRENDVEEEEGYECCGRCDGVNDICIGDEDDIDWSDLDDVNTDTFTQFSSGDLGQRPIDLESPGVSVIEGCCERTRLYDYALEPQEVRAEYKMAVGESWVIVIQIIPPDT